MFLIKRKYLHVYILLIQEVVQDFRYKQNRLNLSLFTVHEQGFTQVCLLSFEILKTNQSNRLMVTIS